MIAFTAPNETVKINGKTFNLSASNQYFTVGTALLGNSHVRPIVFSNAGKTVTLSVNLAQSEMLDLFLTSTLLEF